MHLKAQTVEFLTRISAKVIYGTIILGAVIGSLSDPLPRNLRVIVTVFLSLQAVSMANAYAQSINEDMANHRVTPWRDLWKNLLKPSWLMASTVVPITFFGFALLGFITQNAALIATKAGLLNSASVFWIYRPSIEWWRCVFVPFGRDEGCAVRLCGGPYQAVGQVSADYRLLRI